MTTRRYTSVLAVFERDRINVRLRFGKPVVLPATVNVYADPVDGVPYGYSVLSPSKFRLCAVFSTSTSDRGPDARRFGWYDDEWKHPVGRQCFERMLGQAAAATVSAKAANAARP